MSPLLLTGRSLHERFWLRRSQHWTAWVAWSIWAGSMGLLLVDGLLLVAASGGANADAWSTFLIGVAFPTLGLLVAWRRPANACGWLISALGLTLALLSTSKTYGLVALHARPGLLRAGVIMAWWSGWLFWVILALMGFMILVFPTGRFLSPRWRRLSWPLLATSGALIACSMVLPGDLYGFPTVRNPLGLTGRLGQVSSIGFPLMLGALLVCLGVAATSLLFRYRQAKQEERQQIKWVVSALVANLALVSIDPLVPPGFWGDNIDGLGALLLALALGIALFHYRLWDIDLLIQRTLVYGGLSASIVGLYVFVVGYLGSLFLPGNTLVISLIMTGMVAVLFQPIRDWLQRGVNHLLYGQRDEPYMVITRLSQRLGATVTPEAILPTIVETVAVALKVPYVVILLKREETFERVAAYGQPAPDTLTLPLCYQGEVIGQLSLAPRVPDEAFTLSDRRLLEELARQAGLAAHAVRLTTDLQRSRERLVTAREEERRRLRRDLHDGLGATLAALHLQAGAIRTLLQHDLAAAEAELHDLQTEIRVAVTEIRRLVYALRPPTLDELGLGEAIRQLAAQHERSGTWAGTGGTRGEGLRIVVDVPEQLPAVPAAVEVAAYRIVQEALTNVVRHAQACTCIVRLTLTEGLQLDVVDDGAGLHADYHAGVGLHSMRERAAEVGGVCLLEPAPGRGTQVLVRLPLAQEEQNGSAARAHRR